MTRNPLTTPITRIAPFACVALAALLAALAYVALRKTTLEAFAETAPPPPFEQHYAPAENLEPIDVALLDSAQRFIDIAAYVLTDISVMDALARAAERRIPVRLYRDTPDFDLHGEAERAYKRMLAAGVAERFKDPTTPLMHLKTYCVDGKLLRFGAANFSHSGLTQQDNDLDITRGDHACDGFERDFEEMWGR